MLKVVKLQNSGQRNPVPDVEGAMPIFSLLLGHFYIKEMYFHYISFKPLLVSFLSHTTVLNPNQEEMKILFGGRSGARTVTEAVVPVLADVAGKDATEGTGGRGKADSWVNRFFHGRIKDTPVVTAVEGGIREDAGEFTMLNHIGKG